MRRRPRISHLSKKSATELPRAAKHVTRTDAAEAPRKRSSLDPRRLLVPSVGPRPKPDPPPSSVRGEKPRMKRKRSGEQVGRNRRTDEDVRKRDQSSDGTKADRTGENHDADNEEAATFRRFNQI